MDKMKIIAELTKRIGYNTGITTKDVIKITNQIIKVLDVRLKPKPFPKFMKNDDGAIVYFSKGKLVTELVKGTGDVMSYIPESGYTIGEHSSQWDMRRFKDVEVEVREKGII